MDKITIALIIAQNGLRTAAGLLTAKATKAETQAAAGGGDSAKLKKDAAKARKLAAALNAADTGITAYLTDTSS